MGRRCSFQFVVVALCLTPWVAEARSALIDSTDLKIRNASSQDAIGPENSIFIHPTDSRIILEGQNLPDLSGVHAWVSLDGGKSWTGDNTGAGGPGGYLHPAVFIRRSVGSQPVRYWCAELSSDTGVRANYKESATSLTWTPVAIDPVGDTRPHFWGDNDPNSPFVGRLHAAWSHISGFTGFFVYRIHAAYSTNNGATWNAPVSGPIDREGTRGEYGVNLHVTKGVSGGDVYASWGETDGAPINHVQRIYFNKSTDGGLNWGTPVLIAVPGLLGYSSLFSGA